LHCTDLHSSILDTKGLRARVTSCSRAGERSKARSRSFTVLIVLCLELLDAKDFLVTSSSYTSKRIPVQILLACPGCQARCLLYRPRHLMRPDPTRIGPGQGARTECLITEPATVCFDPRSRSDDARSMHFACARPFL
jgi:hypothetical protein